MHNNFLKKIPLKHNEAVRLLCMQPKTNTQHRESIETHNIERAKINATSKNEEMMQPTKMSSTRNPKHLCIVGSTFANVM
jgi:hypothetical protein